MICKACSIKQIGGGQFNCDKHGHKFITWKCHLCCSESLFRCGNRYLCQACHDDFGRCLVKDCGGVDCPLGIPHPPASKDPIKGMYPLGCSLCRVKTKKTYTGLSAIEEVKTKQEMQILDVSDKDQRLY